jgi:hypothetical protein
MSKYYVIYTIDSPTENRYPLLVKHKRNTVKIYERTEEHEDKYPKNKNNPLHYHDGIGVIGKKVKDQYKKLIKTYKPKKIIPGTGIHFDRFEAAPVGNSVLLWLEKDKYVYIGNGAKGVVIHEFNSIDKIKNFHSNMARYDAPISYAVGEKYIYGNLGDDEIFAAKAEKIDLNNENTVRNLSVGYVNNKKIEIHGTIIYEVSNVF